MRATAHLRKPPIGAIIHVEFPPADKTPREIRGRAGFSSSGSPNFFISKARLEIARAIAWPLQGGRGRRTVSPETPHVFARAGFIGSIVATFHVTIFPGGTLVFVGVAPREYKHGGCG